MADSDFLHGLRVARERRGFRRAPGLSNLHLLSGCHQGRLGGSFHRLLDHVAGLDRAVCCRSCGEAADGCSFSLRARLSASSEPSSTRKCGTSASYSWRGCLRFGSRRIRPESPRPHLLALIVAIGFQCYWTAAAIRYDWSHAYSGSLAAAQYLRPDRLARRRTLRHRISDHRAPALFPREHILRFSPGRPAYWDWSKRNTAEDPRALFASQRRELVLVGYKDVREKQRWADLLGSAGLRVPPAFRRRHFLADRRL